MSGSPPLRNLMLHVGQRDGSQVYIGTTCDNPGPRRLMLHVGLHKEYWVGEGSGSVLYPPVPVYVSGDCVPSSPFDPGPGDAGGIPDGWDPEGGPLACCSAGYGSGHGNWPGIVTARFLFLVGYDISGRDPDGNLDPGPPGVVIPRAIPGCCQVHGMEIPLYYVAGSYLSGRRRLSNRCVDIFGVTPPAGASNDAYIQFFLSCVGSDDPGGPTPRRWVFSGSIFRATTPPPRPSSTGQATPANFYVDVPGFIPLPTCSYEYTFNCEDPLCVEFGHNPLSDYSSLLNWQPTGDPDPRCPVVVAQQAIGPFFEWTCDQDSSHRGWFDIYQVTVFDPASSDGSCSPTWPGSGSGFGFGTPSEFDTFGPWVTPGSGDGSGAGWPNRRLMLRRGIRNGFAAYLSTCCPIGSGSPPPPGPGPGEQVDPSVCCPDAVLDATLTATVTTGGACGVGNNSWLITSGTDPDNGLQFWEGTGTVEGYVITVRLHCVSGGSWLVRIHISAPPFSCDAETTVTGDSCDPLVVEADFTLSADCAVIGCEGGTINVAIT